MPKIVVALILALAAPVLAREPYRPLPRLSDDEVKRRKAEAPPAGPSAPRDEPNASARTEPPAIDPGAPAAPERLPPGPDVSQPTAPRTPEGFREGLSPYGSRGWSTEHGWISRPPWATYPYGRRAYHPGAGWFWMPSYQPFFPAGFAPSFRFTFVPSSRFHYFPIPRYAIAPRFHGGLLPRAFPAARPAPPMARGPAWGGP